MKALITGTEESIIAPYLAKELAAKGYEVLVAFVKKEPKPMDKVQAAKLDIFDYNELLIMLDRLQPNVIFHLHESRNEDDDLERINIEGTRNVIMASEEMDKSPSLVIIGSAEEYGVPEFLPVAEDHPLHPVTEVGRTKALAENLAKDSSKKGFRVIILRLFDLISPGNSLSELAKQIAEMEKGKRKNLDIQDYDSKRDYTDLSDLAKALVVSYEKGDPGDPYNICSGHAYSLKELAERLAKLSSAKIEIKDSLSKSKDPIPILAGDYRKFFKKTGWRTMIDIETSLTWLLEYWRKHI